MKQIILIDVKTKKEFDDMLEEWDDLWKSNKKNLKRMLRNGF